MTEEKRKILEEIIDFHGKEAQMIVAIEELSELQKEITKRLRYKRLSIFGLVEEIADVELMIEQLKMIFGITEREIDNEQNFKIKRTLDKINKKKEKKQ